MISFIVLSFHAYAKTDIYFSPSRKCENNIIKFIDKTENSIDVAVYAINNDNIVNALKRAYDRGVEIRILTDKQQAASQYSKVIELYEYGVNIRVHSKFKIEHNKFAVFDSKIASSGSYNWTNPASHKNSENCIFFIQNKEAVLKYKKRFNYLWQQNTKQKSDKWFTKQQNKSGKNLIKKININIQHSRKGKPCQIRQ